MPLTELAIKNAKPKAKTYRITDGGGLQLEITPTGSKLWRLRYYFYGKQQILSLGKYPTVPLAQARRKRDAVLIQIEAGKHPAREKKLEKQHQANRNYKTFEKMTRKWFEVREKELDEKYFKQMVKLFEKHVFPEIGKMPFDEVTTPQIVIVLEKIGDRGTIETAKRIRQNIGQIFRYGIQRGARVDNPASHLNDILPEQKHKHHACVPISEAPALLLAIESCAEGKSKTALQIAAHTFLRTSEIIAGEWSEIDWSKRQWVLPPERMKMKRPHIVPLSKQVIAILKEQQKLTENKRFIFYSPASDSKHISNGTILMALRRMGYAGKMTGHGFRTLASTILNEKRYHEDVIERQLAHAEEDEIRDAYNRAEYMEERTKMMQDYSDMLDTMLESERSKVHHLVSKAK